MLSIYSYSKKGVKKLKQKDVARRFSGKLWIDITKPTAEELKFIRETFGVHPLTIEDMVQHRTRPKIEQFGNYAFIILYGIRFEKKFQLVELDFILGKNYIISSHLDEVPSFDALKKNKRRMKVVFERGMDYVLHDLIDREVDNYLPALEKFDDMIDELEDQVFADPKAGTLNELYDLKRDMMNIRRRIMPQRDLISLLARRWYDFITSGAEMYFRDVHDNMIRLNEMVDIYKEEIESILEVYMSVSTNKMNEVMKTLTVIATVMMPLTVITGIYGMNFKNMPELSWSFGYPMVLVVMLSIIFLSMMFFKKRKWLL